LKRRDFSPESISALKKAYRSLYRKSLKVDEAISEMKQLDDSNVQYLINFLQSVERGILR